MSSVATQLHCQLLGLLLDLFTSVIEALIKARVTMDQWEKGDISGWDEELVSPLQAFHFTLYIHYFEILDNKVIFFIR